MKKNRERRPANTAEKSAKINRRAFVKLLPAAGVAGATMANLDAPHGASIANAQQAQPQTAQKVSKEALHAAEQLIGVDLTDAQEAMALPGVNRNLASYESLRKIDVPLDTEPAIAFHPALPGKKFNTAKTKIKASRIEPPKFKTVEDLAFSTVTQLAELVRTKQVSPVELTKMYLARLKKYGPGLICVVTLTEELALKQAEEAEREIRRGKYRGPLHGIPYGVKDLLDTKDIPTTFGAEPFRNRVPSADSAVVRRLNDAGAVLLAKLSLGALALNDIWFGGQTMNPWLLEEGASGSSAGPGAATAAALVGFSIGSETGGSIVSPAMRCGVTGLRPTFGRVARSGAMTLCWSLDKLGPMTRSVEDAMLVLQAITGPDAGDASSVSSRLDFDATAPVAGIKVGYISQWMKENPATDVDRAAMEKIKELKMELKEVTLPDWPYSSLMPILFAEGAASFEDLALNNQLGSLKVQVKDAWPNLFREARFLSAVDFVQADRLRRKVALEMARIFKDVDVLLVPSLRDEQLTITNFTGHPSLTLRAGFVEVSEARSDWAPDPANPLPKFNPPRRVPHGITILGRLFDDGLIGQVGLVLERAFGVVGEKPAGF